MSWNLEKCHKRPVNVTKYQEMSIKTSKCHEILGNVTKIKKMSPDKKKCQGDLWIRRDKKTKTL